MGGLEISGREDGKLRELTPEGSFLQVLPWCGGDAAAPKKVKECDLPTQLREDFPKSSSSIPHPNSQYQPFLLRKILFPN